MQKFDREIRLDLAKKQTIVEWIARSSIAKVIGEQGLWGHFANESGLAAFWALTPTERRQIWGDPIDPYEPVRGFEEKYGSNDDLGAPG